MIVYICPKCFCTLDRLSDSRAGYCPDCRYKYRLRAECTAKRDRGIEVHA